MEQMTYRMGCYRMGRFIPRADADISSRIRALEEHLSSLTSELERTLAEMNTTLDQLEAALVASDEAARKGGT